MPTPTPLQPPAPPGACLTPNLGHSRASSEVMTVLTAAGPSVATACISAEWSTASKGSDGQSSMLCRHIRHGGTDDTSISSRADDCANSCAVSISDQFVCVFWCHTNYETAIQSVEQIGSRQLFAR